MNKQKDSLLNVGQGAITDTLRILTELNVTPDHLARIRSDPNFAMKIAQAILGSLPGGKEGQGLLNEVLNSPCPFYPGKKKKDTHFAFMGIRLNLLELQNQFPKDKQPRFYKYAPESWYSKEDFAIQEYCEVKQYLLLKEVIPGSAGLPYEKQIKLLPPGYQPPLAVEEALKDMFYFKKYKRYLNQGIYARTRSVTSDGGRVDVGYVDSDGLNVSDWCGDGARSGVGLGASWDFNS